MVKKIGLCLTTFNRKDYYEQVLSAIPRNVIDFFVIVNDGTFHYTNPSDADHIITSDKQNGVAWAKNRGIEKLLDVGCTDIFTMDDDVIITDHNVFQKYIDTANIFGIYQLSFEKVAGNEKSLQYTYTSTNGASLGLYRNPQAAFCYTHSNIFKKIGLYDENMVNSFEHISYSYDLSKKALNPNFWYFPDVLNSEKYLTTIKGSDENSTITNKPNYKENWDRSASYFIKKHGHFTNEITDVGIKGLEKTLIDIETRLSRKKLVNTDKKLSVIIPYRDREEALKTVVPILHEYIARQVQNFDISVIEQDDNELFNKGLLNNLGFLLNQDSDYHCIHDVDLIPTFSDYSYPKNPTHLSKYCSQFNYIEDPAAIMGGVVLFKKEHFQMVNGYPNDYVGWGKEDSCLHHRIIRKGLTIYQHPFGKYFSTPHQHRLEISGAHEQHLKNSEKWKSEIEGLTLLEDNGVNNLDISRFIINYDDKRKYKHYKIKL